MQESWLCLHIYQEGLCDSRQATTFVLVKKAGPWAGFLRPQKKVPGDGFPESNLRSGEDEGRRGLSRASQTP